MKTIEGLYLITDHNRDGRLKARVKAALKGGARIVQYRDKTRPAMEQVADAAELRELCRKHGALFLVNDDAELAQACDAGGVHLGQEDGTIAEARKRLGHGRIIGISTRTAEEAIKAEMQGADYVAIGSIFPTASKQDAVVVGLETLAKVRRAVSIPVVAIGGIDANGADAALDAGANSVAVISAIMEDDSPEIAAREIALLFNRRKPYPRGRVLTVAGSDSGGGAGIQADIKTITLLGGYASSAITALTAQNTQGVSGIHPVPAEFVGEQIRAVLTDIGTDTLKTGMLHGAEIVALVASAIRRHSLMAVVDPVMIAKGGASLLQPESVEILKIELLPETYLLTPNLPEAAALADMPVENEGDMERAARKLREMGARNVLIKGGHLPGEAVDLLLTGKGLHLLPAGRVDSRNTHGTGCTFSAAIAALLAGGLPLTVAVEQAKRFVSEAIATAPALGSGHGPLNHWQGAKAIR
ncbi:MAG: bifunctional hydroxymethylpyrimidine kinase/phosphomethylpyrimidine kinase [Trichloromonas sp.]|jgi:hydroxymethylpyrimidine kinase/phosphomethylpyrimidine kinase/thiamine-phosphate diphosphorylase|nr:bifunctional hydroxymethylpyrimidine kinase/phosphomethylpyrimidine kinase [Trichloromonas sp.]